MDPNAATTVRVVVACVLERSVHGTVIARIISRLKGRAGRACNFAEIKFQLLEVPVSLHSPCVCHLNDFLFHTLWDTQNAESLIDGFGW